MEMSGDASGGLDTEAIHELAEDLEAATAVAVEAHEISDSLE